MAEAGAENRPSIGISNMSLYNPKAPLTFWLRTEDIIRLAVFKLGYDGVEWHPNRFISGQQLENGNLDPKIKKYIHCLHQNWTGEKSLWDVWANRNQGLFKLSLSLYALAFLPERVGSLDNLVKIQDRLGKRLPAVLLPPESDGARSGTDLSFAETTFQPTPELMIRWKVRTIDELAQEALKRGYVSRECGKEKPGIVVDLHFLRQGGEVNFQPWQESLPQLLEYAKEVHVPSRRGDFPVPGVDIQAESKDVIEGGDESDLSKMLEVVRQSDFAGRVIVESNPWAFSRDSWLTDHKKLAVSLRQRLS